MIAAGLRLEPLVTGRTGFAGARHPTAKTALRAHEMSVSSGKGAVRAPFAVNHDAHRIILVCRNATRFTDQSSKEKHCDAEHFLHSPKVQRFVARVGGV